MEAAEQREAVETELLSWAEICVRFPDQFVCLVDFVQAELRSPEIVTARVVGHGATDDAAFEPIRNDLRYRLWSVRFTGVPTKPLRRPVVVCDDEALEFFFA